MKLRLPGVLSLCAVLCTAAAPERLPGSRAWTYPEDIVAEQYRELRTYYEREIERLSSARPPLGDIGAARREFKALIGAIDEFLPPKAETEAISDFGSFTADLVQWPILRSGTQPSTVGSAGTAVREYGILLAPKGRGPHPAGIVLPDANESPADLAGLTDRLPRDRQVARLLAARGFVVFAPFFTQRRAFSIPWTNDRSWLFRLAWQTGHHLIGSEVQQVSGAFDYISKLPDVDVSRIAVTGSGQGGMIALYAAAIDDRIQTTLVRDYSADRRPAYDEPEDRAIWKQLLRFGDAEVARMAAPRKLLIEGGKTTGEGLDRLCALLKAGPEQPSKPDRLIDHDRVSQVANAQFVQWQMRYRNMALEAFAHRESDWKSGASSPGSYETWLKPKREQYFDVIGRYPRPSGALDAQSTLLYDTEEFSGYRLAVRTYDGVHAYGILLLPKGIRPGERRPVVFTQHGLAGKPEDALGVVPNKAADDVYARFGMRLAQRGYIVFAPMISTQTGIDRDRVARRSLLLGLTPVGMELQKFGRVLDYLSTLDFVDTSRFAFYGLSYGGYTALWTGGGEPRFRVVISSGHFNDWSTKTTDLTQGTSFLFYPNNFDMFNFNLLTRFSHSELAMLIAPRAFLIEVGDRDGVVVVPRRAADAEMERAMSVYAEMKLSERGKIARFAGPHKVDGTEAFAFLDRMFEWTSK